MSDVKQLIKVLELTHKFQKVKRALNAVGEERLENDSEHSYQLALAAWYISHINNLAIDINKLILYALVHDLVEVYAGDVDARYQTPEVIKLKKENEHKALMQLSEEFPEFPELTNAINNYELKQDPESIFISSLDKLLPPINIYLDGGRIWKDDEYSMEEELILLEQRVKHPDLKKYAEQVIQLVKSNPLMFKQ